MNIFVYICTYFSKSNISHFHSVTAVVLLYFQTIFWLYSNIYFNIQALTISHKYFLLYKYETAKYLKASYFSFQKLPLEVQYISHFSKNQNNTSVFFLQSKKRLFIANPFLLFGFFPNYWLSKLLLNIKINLNFKSYIKLYFKQNIIYNPFVKKFTLWPINL